MDGSLNWHRDVPDFDRPRGAGRVRLWLKPEVQSPEIEVRFTPNNGHSEAHAGLPVLTLSGLCNKSATAWSSLADAGQFPSLLSWNFDTWNRPNLTLERNGLF